jgi:hypothetical protein
VQSVAVSVIRPGGPRIRQSRVYCNATLRCVRATTLSMENAISIAYSECVFVALGIQRGGRILSCVAYLAVPCFPHFLINGTVFRGKNLFNIKRVF